jgi:superfamily II DNA or RNA helicase
VQEHRRGRRIMPVFLRRAAPSRGLALRPSSPTMAKVLSRAPEAPPCTALRPYQLRIVVAAQGQNAIVVLPTGSGKTLIAAELVARNSGRALVLVPTKLLVEQQAVAIESWLVQNDRKDMKVAQFCGGKKLASSFDVLISTPKAFEMAQAQQDSDGITEKGSLLWQHFGLVAFDEVGQASLADRALTARRQALVAEELTGCLVCTAIRYTMC